ncbi:MAG: DNA primase, partial [Chloroflexota bacterium]
VSETVTLKKSGRNYTGFCPFHSNTKTPSFVVFPETQTWRCFGACADGGDLFSFVMRRDGFSFKEALESLARRAGVQLQTSGARAAQPDEQSQKLLEINAAAAVYFHHLLTTSPAAAQTRAYLVQRGLTNETIATFQLGYALAEWEALKSYFTQRGYTAEELLAAGLLVARDDGAPGYDRFRNRLMIPIRDNRGRVIGFGARALADEQLPKYLNSPQTELFDKSATLYGLDLAHRHIRQAGEAVIVEGYMDVIQAHQQGAGNVVAQMGTALTEQQLKRVAALANKIVLALDADTAGNAATIRSLSVARQTLPKKYRPTSTSRGIEIEGHLGQEIYIAALPAGKDPDDILRAGLAVWQELMAQAVPSLDFYEALILTAADLATPQGKSFVVRELMPVYREIKDSVEKVARVQRLARKIGLDERLLLAELKASPSVEHSSRRRTPPPAPVADAPVEPPPAMEPLPAGKETIGLGLEEYCLALVLANPAALAMANETLEQQGLPALSPADFRGGENRTIFEALQLWSALETPKIEVLVEMVDELLERRLATLASQWHQRPPAPIENIHHDLSTAVLRLRLQTINEQLGELKYLLQEAEVNEDIENAHQYRETIKGHSQQRRKLHDTTDALSLMGKRRAEANQFGHAL